MRPICILLVSILLMAGCTQNRVIEHNGRAYTFENSFSESQKDTIVAVIDSLLNQKDNNILNSRDIFISQQESTIKMQLKYHDTIRYYLLPDYELFTNDLKSGLKSNKKVEVEITNYDYSYQKLIKPQDTTWALSTLSYTFDDQFCLLEMKAPISFNQGKKVIQLSNLIMPYVLADRDSSTYKIELDKNIVRVAIAYQKNLPIDTRSADRFYYTANQLSDSVFNHWDVYIDLYEQDKLKKSYKNNDKLYTIIQEGK